MGEGLHPKWPELGMCLFGPWMAKTPLPAPTEYRVCVHPNCKKVEIRKAFLS